MQETFVMNMIMVSGGIILMAEGMGARQTAEADEQDRRNGQL